MTYRELEQILNCVVSKGITVEELTKIVNSQTDKDAEITLDSSVLTVNGILV